MAHGGRQRKRNVKMNAKEECDTRNLAMAMAWANVRASEPASEPAS